MAEGQAMSDDDARISEIRARHVAEDTPRGPECGECGCGWPCDSVYLLSSMIRAEEANTAVIRANAEEIADLEDRRDELEARINALTAERDALREAAEDAATIIESMGRRVAGVDLAGKVLRAALAARGGEVVTGSQ